MTANTDLGAPIPRPFAKAAAAFAGGTTPRTYLEACIAAFEAWEPRIDAFVNVNFAAARAEADESTTRWATGTARSPIDGMPVAIKDIIETKDMPTEMGSSLFSGYRSGRDSATVAALRESGAVIFGKTVTTEFAASYPGKTKNPWDATRTPGGSSSGSAAAVSTGVVPAALGTQVIGSIIRPASYCGCIGFKPSIGAINRGGSYDALSQSAHGVLGTTLTDIWDVVFAIVTRVGGDPGYPGLTGPALVPEAIAPVRVALLETAGWSRATPEAKEQLAQLIKKMRARGVEVLDRTDSQVETVERLIAEAFTVSLVINSWEFRWPLITLSQEGLSPDMQQRLANLELVDLEKYRVALAARTRAREAFGRLQDRVDFGITLSATGAAPRGLDSTGDPVFNVPASMLGIPAIGLPLFSCEGLPLGVQLLGFQNEDAALVGAANWMLTCDTATADLLGAP